jgi:hypothetical protein
MNLKNLQKFLFNGWTCRKNKKYHKRSKSLILNFLVYSAYQSEYNFKRKLRSQHMF